MLELAQCLTTCRRTRSTKILGTPAGLASSSQIYAESSLDSTLQSGQLDAASAFVTQAIELHLAYIKLPAADQPGQPAVRRAVRQGDGHDHGDGRQGRPRPARRR